MPDEPDPAFVDTDIFLRYLTGDDPEQAPKKARRLLERAERGEEQLVDDDAHHRGNRLGPGKRVRA